MRDQTVTPQELRTMSEVQLPLRFWEKIDKGDELDVRGLT